jgi:hypothetical protein
MLVTNAFLCCASVLVENSIRKYNFRLFSFLRLEFNLDKAQSKSKIPVQAILKQYPRLIFIKKVPCSKSSQSISRKSSLSNSRCTTTYNKLRPILFLRICCPTELFFPTKLTFDPVPKFLQFLVSIQKREIKSHILDVLLFNRFSP